MRNCNVKLTKYAYLDNDINRTREQIHLILQPKKQNNISMVLMLHLVFIVFVAIFFYTTEKFYQEELNILWDKITSKFMVSQININGNIDIANGEILSQMNFVLPIDAGDLDLNNIREVLLKNPLIKDVSIKINLPGELNINVEERKAAALWFDQEAFHLIDEEGFVVQSNVLLQDRGQIIAAGPGSNKALHILLAKLKEHSILQQIFAAQLISNRRWNILLKSGLIVKLPESNIKEALVALDIVLKNYKPVKAFNIIDLRLAPDKVYAIF